MKPVRFVVMGVSGAGKTLIGTRFARALGIPFVEGDDYHPPDNVARMAAGIPLTDADRMGWLGAIAARIAEAKRDGESLVIACSALKRSYRDLLRTADPDVRFIHLAGDRPLLARRLAQRQGHFMPATLLDSQLTTLETPSPDEHALVCDVAESPETIVAALVSPVT
jgi:carbohydrate kinase (thermoresistant glucokinase family)